MHIDGGEGPCVLTAGRRIDGGAGVSTAGGHIDDGAAFHPHAASLAPFPQRGCT